MKTGNNKLRLDAAKDVLLGSRLTKGWLFDSILLIPFMGVQFFVNIGLAWPFTLLRLAITCSIFLVYSAQKEKPENRIMTGFLIIFLLYAVAILINDENVLDAVSRYYGFIMIICLVNLRRDKIIRLCYSILFTSELLIYANLFILTLYPYPDGLFFSEEGNPHWVIGQKQDFVIVFLPCLISSLFLWFNKVARIRIILVILAMVTTLSLVLTLGLTLVLFMLVFFVFYSFSTNRSIKGTFLFYSYVIMEMVCILIALSKETTEIVFLYLDYLRSSEDANVSKGDTMMQRINMWYDALHNISGNLWGIGSLTEQRFDRLMPNSDYHPHVHNLLIDMAHTGGVLCALLYLFINYWTFKELDKISSNNRNILVYSLFVSNVIALTECIYWPLAVLPLALSQIYIYNYQKRTPYIGRFNSK